MLGRPLGCGVRVPVFLLGGARAVSQQVEDAVEQLGYCVRRFAGASRVETSVEIGEYLVRSVGKPAEVLLARSDEWADAATGGAYAAAGRVPVVVTQRGSLHPAVAAFLRRHGPERVTLLGGGAALSGGVEQAVGGLAATRRVSGAARDITAIEIVRRLWGAPARGGGITLVNGYAPDGWAYALAAAVFGAVHNAPVLYTQAATLSAGTTEFLRGHEFTRVVAAGPASLISGSALDSAASRGSPLRQAARIGPSAVFAEVQIPLGVAVQPNNGRVFVTHDNVQGIVWESWLSRFSRGGQFQARAVLSRREVGAYGALARDPGDGRLWHLLPGGLLQRYDPVTLQHTDVLHLGQIGI